MYERMKLLLITGAVLLLAAQISTPVGYAQSSGTSPMNGMSFEDGVPPNVTTSKGRIRTTKERWSEGQHSLRWDFAPGDSLTIRGPIGYIPEGSEGEGENERVTPCGFNFPVFSDEAYGIDMEIAFGRGDRVDCWADVRLIRAGWEQFRLMYDRGQLRGKAHPDMDFCRLTIKGDTPGTLYLDELTFAKVMRASHDFSARPALPSVRFHPTRRFIWGGDRSELHLSKPWYPLKAKVAPEEADSLRQIEARYLAYEAGGDVSVQQHGEAKMREVREEFMALGIVRDQDKINGPISAGTTPYARLMKRIGVMYRQTKDQGEKAELADLGLQISTHAIQANLSISWYPGRGMADGMYFLRDVLAENGTLDQAVAYIREHYQFNQVYDLHHNHGFHNAKGLNSDWLYTNSIGCLLSVLMMPDSPEKVRDLRHFVKWYSQVATGFAPGLMDSLKPDGSHFHHRAAALEGYGYYTMHVVTKMFTLLAQTEFRLSEEAHIRVRDNLRIRAFYRTRRHFSMAYSQLSYPSTREADCVEFAYLALAGTPDGGEQLDPEMAAHYLRMVDPEKVYSAERSYIQRFKEAGVEPAETPQGHHTLSYYAKGIHRRDNWMAVVGGHSRYVYKIELWPMSDPPNRGGRGGTAFCQFVNTGTLEVIGPDLPGRSMANNGFKEDGWDWTHFPGTTAIAAPLERIRSRVVRVGDDEVEHLFSDQPFVGGLDTSDGQGIFTGTFRGHDKYGLQSMYATKSWFFFDDLIICIGSGIRNELGGYETHTTLFQNALEAQEHPVYLHNDSPLTDVPYSASGHTERPGYLVDNRGTGYYLNRGQDLRLTRKLQKSRSSKDERDTEGLFAKAWLIHGSAPEGGSYEYAVKINADPDTMAGFVADMSGPTPPYEVVQADQRAHIVRHRGTGYLAAALFEKNLGLNLEPISGVSHASLLMVKQGVSGDRPGLRIAVCDPDLRFYEGSAYDVQRDFSRVEQESYGAWWQTNNSIPSTIHIILNGYWEIQGKGSEFYEIVQHANGKTVLAVRCQHGLTREVALRQSSHTR